MRQFRVFDLIWHVSFCGWAVKRCFVNARKLIVFFFFFWSPFFLFLKVSHPQAVFNFTPVDWICSGRLTVWCVHARVHACVCVCMYVCVCVCQLGSLEERCFSVFFVFCFACVCRVLRHILCRVECLLYCALGPYVVGGLWSPLLWLSTILPLSRRTAPLLSCFFLLFVFSCFLFVISGKISWSRQWKNNFDTVKKRRSIWRSAMTPMCWADALGEYFLFVWTLFISLRALSVMEQRYGSTNLFFYRFLFFFLFVFSDFPPFLPSSSSTSSLCFW